MTHTLIDTLPDPHIHTWSLCIAVSCTCFIECAALSERSYENSKLDENYCL